MVGIRLDASSFPSLQGREEVLWAPIFITPILGSPERLVVAVAVAGESERYLCVATGIEKLRCLYGGSSQLIVSAAQASLLEFEAELKIRGGDAIRSPHERTGLLSVGEVRHVEARDLKEMAINWLSAISSLHDSFALEASMPSAVGSPKPRGEQLPGNVWDLAVRKKSPISQYFSSSIRSRARKGGPLTNVSLDYKGKRVVANFSTVRPDVRNIRGEFDRMMRRLWELDVSQVREGHVNSDAVIYELIIQKPVLSGLGTRADRISKGLEDLKNQADDKNLVLRQFDGAEHIVEHLERKEFA